jgi:hypothetical protein
MSPKTKSRLGRHLALLAVLLLASVAALSPARAAEPAPAAVPPPAPAVSATAIPAVTPLPIVSLSTFLCTDKMTNPCNGVVTSCSITCPTGDTCRCGFYEFSPPTGPGCIARLVGSPSCVP